MTHVEALLTETMKAFQMSGQAINRLESFTFAGVKLGLSKTLFEYQELLDAQGELMGHEDLHEYWGVPKPVTEAAAEEATETSEESTSSEE